MSHKKSYAYDLTNIYLKWTVVQCAQMVMCLFDTISCMQIDLLNTDLHETLRYTAGFT